MEFLAAGRLLLYRFTTRLPKFMWSKLCRKQIWNWTTFTRKSMMASFSTTGGFEWCVCLVFLFARKIRRKRMTAIGSFYESFDRLNQIFWLIKMVTQTLTPTFDFKSHLLVGRPAFRLLRGNTLCKGQLEGNKTGTSITSHMTA